MVKVFPELACRMAQLLQNRRTWQERHLALLEADPVTSTADKAAERVCCRLELLGDVRCCFLLGRSRPLGSLRGCCAAWPCGIETGELLSQGSQLASRESGLLHTQARTAQQPSSHPLRVQEKAVLRYSAFCEKYRQGDVKRSTGSGHGSRTSFSLHSGSSTAAQEAGARLPVTCRQFSIHHSACAPWQLPTSQQ